MAKHPFEYQAPTQEQIFTITVVREECKNLYETLLLVVPQSEERTMAIRKLEEVSMWANKAIVFNDG